MKRPRKNIIDIELGIEPKNINFNTVETAVKINALTYCNYRYDNKKAKEILQEKYPYIDFNQVKGLSFNPTIEWLHANT
jgi:hypothetical protein